MSGTHIHVHSAEDHLIEHQAAKGVSLAQWVAILSAIIACCAAMVGYKSAQKETEALLLKNEAIINMTRAADTWSFYQSKKMKAHLMEIAADLTTDKSRVMQYQQSQQRYESEATAEQKIAQTWQSKADLAELGAESLLTPHKRLAQAMILLQVAISLASITALTGKRWLLGFTLLSAVIGVGLTVLSF